jgi:hypothetical protein
VQGGMRACPQCGNVADLATTRCGSCGYNFSTGEAGEDPPRILAEGGVPRIVVDDSNIRTHPPGGGSGGKVAGIAIALVAFLILGIAGFVAIAVRNTAEGVTESFEVDIPDGGKIEIPVEFDDGQTFTRRSCTNALQDAVAKLLRRQAAGRSVAGILTDLTALGVRSFEYRTLVKLYSDLETQSELTSGSVKEAVALARRGAARACSRHYPA